MMAQPVALYLTHFDAAPAKALPSLDFGTGTDLMPAWSPEREQEEIEARIAAAREAGYAEGVEAAQAEAAAEREQAREAFDGELAAERQRWVAQEAESLTEKLAAALQQMQETLAECVGQVLRPFVIDALRRQMIEELVGHVGSVAASHDEIAMKISGPEDLIAELREKLGTLPLAIDYEVIDGVDVQVVTAQTMIETQLKAWIDLIDMRAE